MKFFLLFFDILTATSWFPNFWGGFNNQPTNVGFPFGGTPGGNFFGGTTGNTVSFGGTSNGANGFYGISNAGGSSGGLAVKNYRMDVNIEARYAKTEITVHIKNTGWSDAEYNFSVDLAEKEFISSLEMTVGGIKISGKV